MSGPSLANASSSRPHLNWDFLTCKTFFIDLQVLGSANKVVFIFFLDLALIKATFTVQLVVQYNLLNYALFAEMVGKDERHTKNEQSQTQERIIMMGYFYSWASVVCYRG